ncbi:MAG: DUF2442 domain-containing protein [Candidatus Acidiferrales bacterium]
MVSLDEFERSNRQAKKMRSDFPLAVKARYDRRLGRVEIHLNSGLVVAFSPHDVQGLENAKASQLDEIQISPSGFGLHFPKLDADVYLPSLLQGFFGSRRWMAARLGAAGGKSRSAAKASASRRNGKLGGRPRTFRESPQIVDRRD